MLWMLSGTFGRVGAVEAASDKLGHTLEKLSNFEFFLCVVVASRPLS